MNQHNLAVKQFGSNAAAYLASAVHASGADLTRLTDLARRAHVSRVLDLGCGAGHVSFALARAQVRQVIAYDPAPQMLDVVAKEALARGHEQIETCAGPAERLAFPDGSFDMVVTRYSAHHWLDVRGALCEVARTLRDGGLFVVIDVFAPESPLLDTVLQTLEILRDVSHVRDYRESEWRAMFDDAGFSRPNVDRWKLPMEFNSWVARIGISALRIDALREVIGGLPTEARDYFAVARDHSFAIDAGWLEATKR